MKIKLLTNLGSNDFPGTPFKDGEEHEVADELGRSLVSQRLALDITPVAAPAAPAAKETKPEPVAEQAAEPTKAEPVKPAVTSKQPKQ